MGVIGLMFTLKGDRIDHRVSYLFLFDLYSREKRRTAERFRITSALVRPLRHTLHLIRANRH